MRPDRGDTAAALLGISREEVIGCVGRGLRRQFGHLRHAVKIVARIVDRDPRAVENWFQDVSAPPAADLLNLVLHCDAVAEEVEKLLRQRRAARAGNRP